MRRVTARGPWHLLVSVVLRTSATDHRVDGGKPSALLTHLSQKGGQPGAAVAQCGADDKRSSAKT